MPAPNDSPYGTTAVPGITHRRSPVPVPETVSRLRRLMDQAGATVFAVVDQSGAAQAAGLTLRQTALVVFGSPAAGTPLMKAMPLIAMDLPLKILVWEDDEGQVWMTYLAADWLADRYGLSAELAQPLSAPEVLSGRAASS